MNVAAWVFRWGQARPENTALARGEGVYADYATFARHVAGLARSLRDDCGCRPGDRAAIIMSNCPEYLEALFGAWHGGLVVVPINARLHPTEIAWILENSQASVVITDSDLANEVAPLAESVPSLRKVVVAPGAEWRQLVSAPGATLAEREPDDPAWIFYTSGTTGRPKGATLTHRNLLAMSLSYFADIDPIRSSDAILHVGPLSHGSGLYALPHVARGAACVVPETRGFDPAEIVHLISRWQGVSLFAAPTVTRRLAAEVDGMDLTSLKTIVYGAAPMYLADLRMAIDVFGPRLSQIYGQGESPMTITALDQSDHADSTGPRWVERLQSVGLPRTDVEVRIVDPDDEQLPVHEVGEVVVRGDVVMSGYWNDAKATAEALRGGWLHTGDMGSFDEHGYLTLRDRLKDVIISGGINVYPREVEEVLVDHPGVREAAVLGAPDPEWGEAVVAFVVPERLDARPTVEELDRSCLDRIARFKRPREYKFVEQLPKNNYGKVVKRDLRWSLEQHATSDP